MHSLYEQFSKAEYMQPKIFLAGGIFCVPVQHVDHHLDCWPICHLYPAGQVENAPLLININANICKKNYIGD